MNETKETRLRKANFPFFGIAGGLYALFYTICMYRNASGITYPFFIAGSLLFFCLCMKKLEISVKKGSICYMAGMMLLGISTILTADGRIIFFNHVGVILLMVAFLLHQFYEDKNWRFGRYLASVICVIFASLGEITKPFTDFMHYRRQQGHTKRSKGLYVVIGLCVAFPLFIVVWFLLMTADRVFMSMTEDLFEALDLPNVIGMIFTTVLMFLLSYGAITYLSERQLGDQVTERKRVDSTLAITVTLPLTLMYLVFSGVQIVCLFMGNVDLGEMTYAEYARQGFFQLLLVCILNLILVLVGGHYFKESVMLKIILTVMSLCTYVMIFSSGMRMILYIKHYYFTFLRILVLWALVVIFLLLTGVLASIFAPKFPLFRYGMAVVSVCYIALSFSRPDYLVATCNLGNAEGQKVHNFFDADAYHDYEYLSNLNADAAPVILPYLEQAGYNMTLMSDEEAREQFSDWRYSYECTEEYGGRWDSDAWGYYYMRDLAERVCEDGVREFNVSRFAAMRQLKAYWE